MKTLLLLFITALCTIAWSPSYKAFQAYQKNDFSAAQKILEQKQIDAPLDPLINYNLGTTYYKQKKYEAAKQSFLRATKHSFGRNATLHDKATFNLANSYYKNTLAMLPENWEKEKLDDEVRKKAINEVQQAIASYKTLLEKNKEDERIKTNHKAAEELLKKLQQNQQNQQQQKKPDKEKEKQDQKKQDKKQDQQKSKQKKKQNQEQKKQQQKQQQKPKSMEQRKREVVLSKLDKQEKKLQKALLKQKSKKQAKPQNSYQKSW